MDATTPPKSAKQTILSWSVLAFLLIALIGLVPYSSDKSKSSFAANVATNNARQIGILLIQYDGDNGHLPTSELPLNFSARNYIQQDREDSNYILGHLIRGGYTDAEEIF